jgi:hypothetical protein|tara:strand:+ start:340 stop:681 length:342 start_codon:yes stop_codon:yes gene_type:complete
MTKEEKQKLNEREIYKLFNRGDIDAREFDELRKALPSFQQEKLNKMILSNKKREIIKLYKEGGLSISDTLAYENNLLLERNRKNTSTITTILAVCAVITILGVMIPLFGLTQI